jgi:hypothetical protein
VILFVSKEITSLIFQALFQAWAWSSQKKLCSRNARRIPHLTCYHPWTRSLYYKTVGRVFNFDDKPFVHFDKNEHLITLPCGRCIGCYSDQARSWAIRCHHEHLYPFNVPRLSSFLTLTYSDEHLIYGSDGPILSLRHITLFLNRLRNHFKFRYFYAAEYGSKTFRPHYHILLFGHDFIFAEGNNFKYNRFKSSMSKRSDTNQLYESLLLEELWPYGKSIIGDVTFKSISYVTRYLLKKADAAAKGRAPHRAALDCPEFRHMSRRPGLGHRWFELFGESDLYPHDNVIISGKKLPIPRFYSQKYRLTNPIDYTNVLECRNFPSKTAAQLNAAEAVKTARAHFYAPQTL